MQVSAGGIVWMQNVWRLNSVGADGAFGIGWVQVGAGGMGWVHVGADGCIHVQSGGLRRKRRRSESELILEWL